MSDNARRFATWAGDVPANGEVDIDRAGSYFRLLSGAPGLLVRIDDEPPGSLPVGLGIDCPVPFRRLTVVNSTGAAVAFEMAFGRGQIDDNRLTVSGELSIAVPSALSDAPDVALLAGAAGVVVAANPARKEVLITNLASNPLPLRVGAATVGAARGVEVSPGQTVTLSTKAAVYAFCAGAQSVAVVEVAT